MSHPGSLSRSRSSSRAAGRGSREADATRFGDVVATAPFQTMAKTLGVALGVDRARLDEAIEGGQVLEPTLAS